MSKPRLCDHCTKPAQVKIYPCQEMPTGGELCFECADNLHPITEAQGPTWDARGEPLNLLAAADDALKWLDFFTGGPITIKATPQNLIDCRDRLRAFLTPKPDEEDESRPCPSCGEEVVAGANVHQCDRCKKECCTACSGDHSSAAGTGVLCDECDEHVTEAHPHPCNE